MRKYVILLLVCVACRQQENITPYTPKEDTNFFATLTDSVPHATDSQNDLGEHIVAFAKTQMGVPYKYCSMTPDHGFDCSGFVNYVFNEFNIKVPRSSVDFTNIGKDVGLEDAQPGDLILFTGTNPRKRQVGHIGIIVNNDNGQISFIHSTSGEAFGVTISNLDEHYMKRFVKIINILEQPSFSQ